ncbi:MAG: lipoate---protein ligase [Betaproteobacteria bacterium]|nr:lipoate---protein ligase [Betaproteobacteria bacterium]
MSEIWRLLDTGLQSPIRNIALSRALLEARHADEIPSTLRFGRSTGCVLVGYSEHVEQVVDVEACREHGIPIYDRLTNGSTGYIDERHLLCELYLHRRDVDISDVRTATKRICHAAATAIGALGVNAHQRAGTEIEVDGRVIGSVACALDGRAIVLQTALIMHSGTRGSDVLTMGGGTLGKAAAHAVHARTRSLQDVLGSPTDAPKVKHNLAEAFESEFDVEFRDGDLTLSEQERSKTTLRLLESGGLSPRFADSRSDLRVLEATHECRGAVLRALLLYDVVTQAVRQAWFSDEPAGYSQLTMVDLEAWLRDTPLSELGSRIQRFFTSRTVDTRMPSASDFLTVMRRAIEQPFLARNS